MNPNSGLPRSDVYDLHAPLLYSLACRMLGDETEAADALQEVLLQAWRKSSSYDPAKGSLRTWLVVLTRSRCLDRLRRRAVRRGRETSLPDDAEPADDRPLAPQELEDAERRLAVRAALAQLPEPQRKAVEAAFYDGMTQMEIATATGEPLGTVKTRVRLGMRKLAELLKAHQAP